MCKVLKVSRSGYYKHISKTKSKRDIENEILSDYIKKYLMNINQDMVPEGLK